MIPSDTSPRSSPHQEAAPPLGWNRYDWAALALVAALTALFFWRILTPKLADRASFPPGDFAYQFWAFSTFEVRELSAGRLPLWNPYTYAGAPFWADIQSAVLYPLSLLTLVLSGAWGFSLFALEVEAIFHFWLAGAFTYLFVRRLIRQRGAALFAALTFTFGGYLTGYPSQQLAVLETTAWLPLLLYCVDRSLIDRSDKTPYLRLSLPNILAAGLVWGLALLAGHPQSALFVFYTLILYAMYLILAGRKHAGSTSAHPPSQPQGGGMGYFLLLTPLVIILIGLGLAAVAWLPGLEYMRLSVRAGGLYDNMSGGFPLYDPIQMLLPGSVSFYSPLYVGVLPLLLAIWAALTRRKGETLFWGALAAGAFLLSFGGETFLYTPFYLLAPGFSIFRGQERAAFIVSFALTILAGYGFMQYVKQPQTPRPFIPNLQSATKWLLIGAIGLVVLFFYALNRAGWQADSPFYLLLGRSVWLAILLGLIWSVMRIRDRRFLAAGYLLIAALDLFTANWQTNIYPALPEQQTAVPAVVKAIRQDASPDEVFRVFNEYRIYENYGVPYALEDTWGASPLRLARYDRLYRTLRMERLWELLNVKYVITWRKELYTPSEIIYQEPVGDEVTYVHRLNQVAPRAWLVYRVEKADESTALTRLDAPDFDPSQAALVPPGAALRLSPPGHQPGQVHIVRRTPGSLALDVATPSDALLVLSEIYYPGWQAALDGQATPIVEADYILRGMPVPAGSHRVELSYRPVSLIVGAIISSLTLVTLAVLGVWIWRGKQRVAPHSPSAGGMNNVASST